MTSSSLTIKYNGGSHPANGFIEIPENIEDKELYLELERLVNENKILVSLDQITVMSKEESLKYLKNYTISKTDYLIYDKVYAHARFKDLSHIDYKTDLNGSLHFLYTYVFGRKLRKVGYWYGSGLSDPIIRIDYDYEFDVAFLVEHVTKKISYYKRDSSLELNAKIAVDVYPFLRKGEEQRQRRKNIYTNITGLVQNVLIGSEDYTLQDIESITSGFIDAITPSIRNYIDNGNYHLVDLLRDNTSSELESIFGVSDLSFLDIDYQGSPFKDMFVSLLDYRTAEDAQASFRDLYQGSSL